MPQKKYKYFTPLDFLIFIVIAVIIAAISVPNITDHSDRARYSRCMNDIRTMRTGIEAYAVDYIEYPRMTWASVYGDTYVYGDDVKWFLYGTLMPAPAKNSAGRPIERGIGGAITTPIAYLNNLPADPFYSAPSGEGLPTSEESQSLGVLYMYWNAQTYRQILEERGQPKFRTCLPYAPDEKQLEAFERELGQYVIWSIGPAGWEDFEKTGRPIFLPYDPTNGTISSGSVFISQKTNEPCWVDYEALEPTR